MAVREVLMLGDPRLRERSRPVGIDDPALPDVVRDLEDTLSHLQRVKGMGRALAAPQIGHTVRIVRVQAPGWHATLVDPELDLRTERTVEVWDSCYSFDLAFFVLVERYEGVRVRYHDEHGRQEVRDLEGAPSGLLQHEVDHLDGVLAVDRIRDPERIMMRSQWERRHRGRASSCSGGSGGAGTADEGAGR